jgi:ribonuclease J
VDKNSGSLTKTPEIISRGFVFQRDSDELFAQVTQKINGLVESYDVGELSTRIEKDLSKFFYAETKRRPMIMVLTSHSPSKLG